MQEQFEQLRQALSQDIDQMLEEKLDRKLDEKLDRKFDEQFAAAEQRLSETIGRKLDEKFASAEKRLSDQFKIHAEDVRQIAKTTAENYGGVLESIYARLDELDGKVERFSNYERHFRSREK